jgi:SAM-dependent methyltransferase
MSLIDRVHHRLRAQRAMLSRAGVERILRSTNAPDCIRAEQDFARLQRLYPPFDERRYGYDPASIFVRAAERCRRLFDLGPPATPGLSMLEVGCGDGVVGAMLQLFGHSVVLTDLDDWRHAPAKQLPFHATRLEAGLPLPDASFDLVFSYNSFEHVDDPRASLNELVRLCRPGGLIHLDFGPLFASPWGMHAYRQLRMPYAQFLFREAFVLGRLAETGVSDLGRTRTELQPMNRWRVAQFDELFNDCGCVVKSRLTLLEVVHVGLVKQYAQAFQGRGLTWDDLVTSHLRVTLERRRA